MSARFPSHVARNVRYAKTQGHAPVSTSGTGLFRCERCNRQGWLDGAQLVYGSVGADHLARPCPTPDAPTPLEIRALVWQHTHRDFRGVTDGVRTVLILRAGGTTLVSLSSLTDDECLAKLTSKERARVIAARAGKAPVTRHANISNRTTLSDIAHTLDLPTWGAIDELNTDHYHEAAHAACGGCCNGADLCEAYLAAEMAAQTDVFRAYRGAVLAAAESALASHHLALEAVRFRHKGKRIESDHDYRIVLANGRTWTDAADRIRDTIEGVGSLGYYEGGTRGFLRSGPYTARSAVLSHLHWIKRRSEVYGTSSPTRIYQGAWRS